MLEFQIEYPRGSGFACGRTEEAGCATVRDVRFSIRTSLETLCFAQALGCSSALPCAEPVLHSLDYRIELVSFRNRIRYG
jgi:hypothetical protein